MADLSEAELEALAASLADISDDVEIPPPEDPPINVDVVACVRALNPDLVGSASSTGPPPPGGGVGAMGDEELPSDPKKRRAAIARLGKLRKKQQRLQEAGASARRDPEPNPAPSGSMQLVVHRQDVGPVTVQASILKTIESRLRTPFGGPHLQAAVRAALGAFVADASQQDADVVSIVQEMCMSADARCETKVALADRLGVDRGKVDRLAPLIADAIMISEQLARRRLEGVFSKAGGPSPVLYIESCRYDETPMPATTKDVAHAIVRPSAGASATPEGAPGKSLVRRVVLGTDAGTTKFFQSEVAYCLLGKCVEPSSGDPTFFGVHSNAVTYVQALVEKNAAAYKEALGRVCCPSAETLKFPLPLRLATCDKDASNLKAEREIAQERGDPWAHLAFTCDVHTAAGCHTKVATLVQDEISGILHLALSLCASGHMGQFRRCIIEYVEERMLILYGRPSASAIEYKMQIMDLFLARGSDFRVRRALVQSYLPGDWRNHEDIEYYRSPGMDDDLDDETLRGIVAHGVVRALANRRPHTYPRHRWTGFDLSLDEVGMLEAAHGILSHSYRRFLARFAPMPRRPSGAASQAPASGARALALGDEEHDQALDIADAPDLYADLAKQDAPTPSDWAQQNETHRKVAAEFVGRRPLGKITIMRRVFEPFRKLLNQLISMSSDKWDRKQASLEAAHLLGKGTEPRAFRVLVAALQTLENNFQREIAELGKPGHWSFLPAVDMDVATRGLVFRMLSKALVVVEVLLKLGHDAFPTKLFLLLADADLADLFEDEDLTPPCMVDSSAKACIAKYGLRGQEAQVALRMIAIVAYLDIVQIEQRHAPLRRRLKVMAPTNAPTVSDLSSDFVFRQFRLRRASGGRVQAKTKRGERSKKRGKRGPTAGARKGGGGAWRAYVRRESKGKRGGLPNAKELAAKYAALAPEERASLLEVGRIATASARRKESGANSFGPSTQTLRRASQRRLRQHLAQRNLVASGSGGPVPVLDALVVAGGSVQKGCELARLARCETRRVGSLERAREFAQDETLQTYQSSLGEQLKTDLLAFAPELSDLSPALSPWPDRSVKLFRFAPDTATTAEQIVSYALQNAKSSNLMSALSLDWDMRIKAIGGDLGGVDPTRGAAAHDDEGKGGSECRAHGVCVCSAEGKVVLKMCRQFLKAFKPFVKRGTQNRQLLLDGAFVLKLHWAEVVPVASGAEGAGEAAVALAASGDLFWHVAWTCLSPYEPNFQPLDCVDGPDLAGRFAMRAPWSALPFRRAIESLNRDWKWTLQWFRLRETFLPLAVFDPSAMEIEPAAASESCFWDPTKKPRGRRQRKGKNEAPADDSGDVEDAAPIADEEVDSGAEYVVASPEASEDDAEEAVDPELVGGGGSGGACVGGNDGVVHGRIARRRRTTRVRY